MSVAVFPEWHNTGRVSDVHQQRRFTIYRLQMHSEGKLLRACCGVFVALRVLHFRCFNR